MKINGQYPKLPVQEKSTSQTNGKDKADGRQEVKQKSGTKDISSMDLTITRMREKLDSTPDINQEKINAIKAKIKQGEYKIDMEKLAQQMLKNSIIEDS